MQKTEFNDNFSVGCQSCQEGKWLCIFLTYLCNAKCDFCPAPFKQQDKIVSAFGDTPASILENIRDKHFTGISFSGGECFLVFDRLIEWLSFFKKQLPNLYYWVYSNGLAVSEEQLKRLADAGLDEIRFNIAASNYNSPTTLQAIALATDSIKNVAVEVPSIPGDFARLVEVLPRLEELNVKYLNLHEYILMPEDRQFDTAPSHIFIMNKQQEIKFDTNSLTNTESIVEFCQQKSWTIKVNNCSLQKKENQMLQRRLMMGRIVKKKYEYLTHDGMLETCFIFPQKLCADEIKKLFQSESRFQFVEKYLFPPEILESKETNTLDGTVAKLSFIPPMSMDGKRVLYQTEIV